MKALMKRVVVLFGLVGLVSSAMAGNSRVIAESIESDPIDFFALQHFSRSIRSIEFNTTSPKTVLMAKCMIARPDPGVYVTPVFAKRKDDIRSRRKQ